MEVLNPRSVLVTGSNRGIGLELVKQLVGKSNPPEWIFATCRDPEGPRAKSLKNLAAQHQHRIEIIQLDTSDPSSIKAAAAKITECLHGAGLNLLFNNAGIVKSSSLESETPENMLEVYNTNVVGPMVMGQVFLPLLRKASKDSLLKGMSCSKAAIVNISSDCGSITNLLAWDIGQIPNYRCSKAALNMLNRCQSLQYAQDEILCVALHPGWLQTDMGSGNETLGGVVAPTPKPILTEEEGSEHEGEEPARPPSPGPSSLAMPQVSAEGEEIDQEPGVSDDSDEGDKSFLDPRQRRRDKQLRAPTTAEDGVQEILKTLAHLSEKETGTFVNVDGKLLPW